MEAAAVQLIGRGEADKGKMDGRGKTTDKPQKSLSPFPAFPQPPRGTFEVTSAISIHHPVVAFA
ncbi:MAG: hypothetical protein BJ554DRAFT_3853 [Olpidium bornovanus]|uniref:Uncharacterized protein n=1 Tax=Olpidium bornovanus TaxID=278681 RepID=A0A8H8DF82_9FUNG|nr:MAG: hypothetical protein BJ554DRAFT_3853 [Olpidium bornovanus]